MAIDYEAYDLKSLFSVVTSALLWHDIEQIDDTYRKRVDVLIEELKTDVFNGKLKYRTDTDHQKSADELYKLPLIFIEFTDCLSKEDLREWAISRGHRPKFLFPEDRGSSYRPLKSNVTEISKKEIAPRPNQIIRARCQAVASMLWVQNPNYTQKEIVKHPDMKTHGYRNAAYDERTMLGWVAEEDPRAAEVRKTPYSKLRHA